MIRMTVAYVQVAQKVMEVEQNENLAALLNL